MSTAVTHLMDQRDRFLAFVRRRVSDRSTAEDILQIAYLRAVSNAHALKSDESADAWFFRILRNAIIDHYRHHSVETRTFASWEPHLEHPSVTPETAPDQLCLCLHDAIKDVSPSYQEIVREIDLGETPIESFAERAGITRGNAAVRAHRAHASLRKKLLDRCGDCALDSCLDCTCGHASADHL